MRAFELVGPERVTYHPDAPTPSPERDEVLIRVGACSVCNRSDLIYYRYIGRFQHCTPRGFGHEVAGYVERTGSGVTEWKVGDRVFARSLTSTGYAEFTTAKATKLGRLPDGIPFEQGAILQLAPLVLNATRHVEAGQKVFIAGQGPVGLLALQMARLRGAAEVVVSDLDQWRLERSRALGADAVHLVSVRDPDPGGLDERMDVFIDAVGRPSTIALGIRLVRPGGKVVMLGTHHIEHSVPIDMIALERKSIDLVSSRERTYTEETNALRAVERLAAAGRIELGLLLTHVMALEELPRALEVLKVSPLLFPEGEDVSETLPPANTLKIAITP